MTKGAQKSSGADFVALSDRLMLLFVVRLLMAGTVLLASTLMARLDLTPLAVYTAQIYMVIAIVVELVHRLLQRKFNRRLLFFVDLMLILDGIYVSIVLSGSGDARSTFIFLAYAHIVSVTLLIGFRTGLKMAIWQSLLLFSMHYLVLAGVINSTGFTEMEDKKLGRQLEVAQVIALWVVAICTAVFAGINERELRRRKGELTIIADLSNAVERTRRPTDILRLLTETTVAHLGCRRAIAVCVHDKGVVVVGEGVHASVGKSDSLQDLGGVIAQSVVSAAPVLVRSVNSQRNPIIAEYLPDAVNVSVMPMITEGTCISVLISEWGERSKKRVTQPMIDLLQSVAGRVALSLSNTFLLAENERLASVDGLTGLPNRRKFNEAIQREVARAARNGTSVSLVMLDIDHFKSVNDTYGHQMGDTVLSESAAGVMRACRTEDLPARYGGEEIAIIMPGCPENEAFAAAERIRAALGAANRALPGTHASAGVATYPNHCDSVESLMAAADEALYASKENGRDRSTMSTRTGAVPVVSGANSFESRL